MSGAFSAEKIGVLYDNKDAPVIYFSLAGHAFLSIYHSDTKLGAGVLVADHAESLSNVVKNVNNWLTKANLTLSSCEIKLIGNASQVAVLKRHFSAKHVTEKIVGTEHVDLFFYPDTNRLRMATAQPVLAVVPTKPVKVIIVDDSKTIRTLLKSLFAKDPAIEVLGEANGASELLDLLKTKKPDVITLDIHMPEMDGVQLLKKYIPSYRIPTVVITSLSKEEGPLVFEALSAGAVDYVQKPSSTDMAHAASEIIAKVKEAANAKVFAAEAASVSPDQALNAALNRNALIAIGSSTGGTDALQQVLTRLPADIPPIVIVQHIPPVFSLAFANRLNEICSFEVKEAAHGDEVRAGRVLIAPGGMQMRLVRKRGLLEVAVEDSPAVNRHKPSVDVLFASVAKEVGKKAIGVILTGMGSDGAKGLLEMKHAGAPTIAQDEATCVVYGMPREAVKLGAADEILPLTRIPKALVHLLTVGARASAVKLKLRP